MTSCRD